MWLLVSGMVLTAHGPSCTADHDKLVTELKRQFKEELVAVAVTKVGTIMELAASDEGSWTILVTFPPPRSETCIIGSGEGFELILPGEES